VSPDTGEPPVAGAAREAVQERATVNVITTKPLRGIPEIRRFFRTNETPIYFISATAFNLLGIDRWVRHFRFVNYYDSFDGWHPNVITPKEQTPRGFSSIDENPLGVCSFGAITLGCQPSKES